MSREHRPHRRAARADHGVQRPPLVLGDILVTGEMGRVTEFERGMPPTHQARDGPDWRHDPAVIDDQAPVFKPVIEPTVSALTPELIAAGHCTGWRAHHTLAATLPDAWVQSSVGSTYTLSAA